MIYLEPKKVARHFGLRPHLGRRIPIKVMRHTGVEWRQFKGEFIPKEHVVNIVLALVPIKGRPGFWDLKVDPKYLLQAVEWLMETIGPRKPLKGPTKKQEPWRLNPLWDPKQGRWRKPKK